MMKKLLFICICLWLSIRIAAQNRFPKPDFESGYQYPDITYQIPNDALWTMLDILLLVILMSIVTWAVFKKRTRKPIIGVSIISVLYFGFFRNGCICSIGAIQNVSLALADHTYILPVSVFLFFILPILYAFFFGRVFCAGVCPLGAIQELVHLRHYKLPGAITAVLNTIPWIYLIFAVLYAVTQSSFIICRFDPFIGIFRLGGELGLIIFGVLLLIAAVFTGRPFCRFMCPYGALLSLFSRVSIWKIKLTESPCINCELCHNACPVDAIRAPYDNRVKEHRMQGVKRIVNYALILPLMMAAGGFLMYSVSGELSRTHKEVRLYDMVMQHETTPQEVLSLELEAFYGQGMTIEELTERYHKIEAEFKLYPTIGGVLIGLVIGFTLIGLSVKRARKLYEIDHADCVACGRCFSYCPQNHPGKENSESKIDIAQ